MAWNPSKNQVFFQRMVNVAAGMQDLRDEIARLEDIWFAENVSASGDFVDTDVNGVLVSTGQLIDFIQNVAIDYTDFFENRAVPQADRVEYLAKLLAGASA